MQKVFTYTVLALICSAAFAEEGDFRNHNRAGQRGLGPAVHLIRIADSDRDGATTTAEWERFLSGLQAAEDGTLSSEDLVRVLESNRPENARRRPPRQNAPEGFNPFDLNQDGLVSYEDLDGLFYQLDRNADGVVAADELPRGRRDGRRNKRSKRY